MKYISKLFITGQITNITPIVVILEICKTHGFDINHEQLCDQIYLDKIISHVNKIKPIIIDTLSTIELKKIARFVNPDEKWDIHKLNIAINNILTFNINSTFPFSPYCVHTQTITSTNTQNHDIQHQVQFKPGYPTNDEPYLLPPSILYRLCMNNNIYVDKNCTIEDMCESLQLLYSNRETLYPCIINISKSIRFIEQHDLINIYNIIKKYSTSCITTQSDKQVNYDDLEKLWYILDNKHNLSKLVPPSTQIGSISLAAINWDIDLSKAKTPILEYDNLLNSGLESYIPNDKYLLELFNFDHNLIRVNYNFNPIFPIQYYTNIISLAIYNGYYNKNILTFIDKITNKIISTKHIFNLETKYKLEFKKLIDSLSIDKSECYEFLQLNYHKSTFYDGLQWENKNAKKTIFDENIESESKVDSIICYGYKNGSMKIFTISDLIHMFDSNKNFEDPFNPGSVFQMDSIIKLKYICLQTFLGLNYTTGTKDIILLRIKLLSILKTVDDFELRLEKCCERLINCENKKDIIYILNKLFELSMYMRGWDGKSSYPEGNCPIHDKKEVNNRVINKLIEFNDICETNLCYKQVLELILVEYKSGVFLMSTSVIEGFTIKDRLNIVNLGKSDNSGRSCFRLSSGWFLFTSWYYLNLLKVAPNINLDNQKMIN